ncbi:MAG: DUF2442 domain-containing protein [Acidobacteriota bacterium]
MPRVFESSSYQVSEVRAVKVWFDDDNIWLGLEDGRQVSTPLAFYPRLLNATKEQRENYEFIGPGIGIHWEDLDEDLSVEGIVLGRKDRTSNWTN